MEIRKIDNLSYEWHKIIDEVIEFKKIDFSNLQKLFRDTYSVLGEYRNEKLVPKEISKLLLEINDFGWWVSDLKETPLHCYYQEIVSVVYNLNTYFLTPVSNSEKILKNIDKIV